MMQHDYADSPVAQDYGKELGVPFKVFLTNGVKETIDKKTGEAVTEITDLPGLIACVLQARVLHRRKLSGDDLRFIRLALRMRSADVAEALDVSPEHYSRCEAGTKTLSNSTEKFWRMRVYLQACVKNLAIQKAIAKVRENNQELDPEEMKEAFEAFQSLFFDMKIANVFPAGEELSLYFVRGSDDHSHRCGKKDDEKWRREPVLADAA
jgi:hypothetical protein